MNLNLIGALFGLCGPQSQPAQKICVKRDIGLRAVWLYVGMRFKPYGVPAYDVGGCGWGCLGPLRGRRRCVRTG